MNIFTKLVIAIIVAALGVVGFAYSGLYNVGASSAHGGLANWLLSTTSRASVERRAGDIAVPDLNDKALRLAGVNDYQSMCAGCHGAPGQLPEAVGKGLNPPAPDLAESAARMTAAELFWVTKNGIKMSGMPAWGATHDDEALWPVVAFMTLLPDLEKEAYQSLLEQTEGMGHHSAEASHPHDDGKDRQAPAAHTHDNGAHQTEPEATPSDVVTGSNEHNTEHHHDSPASTPEQGSHDDSADHEHH